MVGPPAAGQNPRSNMMPNELRPRLAATPSGPGRESRADQTRRDQRRAVMTRTKPAEQRRADLLAAGQALFLAKGIAGTSLDDITRRGGGDALGQEQGLAGR